MMNGLRRHATTMDDGGRGAAVAMPRLLPLTSVARDWLIVGHFGARNTGDDAMLTALLREPGALHSWCASSGEARRSLTPWVMSKAWRMLLAQSARQNVLTACTACSMLSVQTIKRILHAATR